MLICQASYSLENKYKLQISQENMDHPTIVKYQFDQYYLYIYICNTPLYNFEHKIKNSRYSNTNY